MAAPGCAAAPGCVAVIGEALIDLVAGRDGEVAARPGGGPFNTARTLARLGVPAVFAGRLSGDAFGRLLRERLAADGVALALPAPSAAPTTLAVADVDAAGVASYHFYLDGTAAAEVDYDALRTALAGDAVPAAVHVGTLGLVLEPAASSAERLITSALPPGTLVMADPNCRPGAIPGREAYLGRLSRIARRADIVKASTEDLAYLVPGAPPGEAAATLLGLGAGIVIVTDGPRPARAFLPSGREVSADAPAVRVADTIGAGDAFGGAFLAYWTRRQLTRAALADPETVRAGLAFAARVAALTCARPGADPPRLAELPDAPLPPAPVRGQRMPASGHPGQRASGPAGRGAQDRLARWMARIRRMSRVWLSS
jgi:fructokinase